MKSYLNYNSLQDLYNQIFIKIVIQVIWHILIQHCLYIQTMVDLVSPKIVIVLRFVFSIFPFSYVHVVDDTGII
jgi:hypothetical protein